MFMADWIAKLDDFLRLSDRDILTHAGRISHDDAVTKAEIEFEKYRQEQAALKRVMPDRNVIIVEGHKGAQAVSRPVLERLESLVL